MGNKTAVYGTAAVVLVAAANLLHTSSHVGQDVVSLPIWQWVYVVGVLYLAPVAAADLLWTRYLLAGAWLLLASMAGSFAFDFAYHFLIPGPDNVFTLQPGPWLVPFWATSVLLVVSTGLGTAVGVWLWPRSRAAQPDPGPPQSNPGDPLHERGHDVDGDKVRAHPEARAFDRHRRLLFSTAYRMLGSVMNAEDIVQEANLRWRGVEKGARSSRACLSTVVARLSIDRLRTAME